MSVLEYYLYMTDMQFPYTIKTYTRTYLFIYVCLYYV